MKLIYRPEIDGLRAIAVGAVILYHANITILGHQPFKGGFIGVDIFFVISGYLITSIILKELVTTGAFSFKHFYERRIRRILPALLFVMLVSLPFAWMYLLSSSFVDFSKSILYSLGFSSNFYFHFSGEQYGATSGLFKPMLHTWSLSVEEQYYILFPIILLIIFKYFRKYLIHILILSFAISLGLADWGSRNYPSFTFYVLPTRAWELLAGSILAYFEIKNVKRSKNKSLNLIFPTLGLLLIGHSIVFFNDRMFHPSFYTLSPIIGVCLIIWFSDKNELITKILSTKLFVAIGLISYSLYLWHYPIFAFARIIEINQGSFYKLLIAIIVILLSIVSYYFIERPFRNKKYKFKLILIVTFSLYCILLATNFHIIKNNGFKNLRGINNNIINLDNTELLVNSMIYVNNKNLKNIIDESFYSKDGSKKILFVGDSHSVSMFNIFYLNKGLFNEFRFNQLRLNPIDPQKKLLLSKKYLNSDIIVFNYRFDVNKIDYIKALIPKIKNKKIIIMSTTNEYKNNFKRKNYFNLTLADTYILDNNISIISQKEITEINKMYYDNNDFEAIKMINIKIENLAKKNKILFLSKQEFLCDNDKNSCFAMTENGKKIFYDGDHYTLEGAKFFGKKIKDLNWFKIAD